MQLNYTLETTTFEIPDSIDTSTPLLFKAFYNNITQFDRIQPAIRHPPVRASKTVFPYLFYRAAQFLKAQMRPRSATPYLIASIGSNYAFSIRNSQKIEVRASNEENTRSLLINLQQFARLYKGQGIQAISFASSSLLLATSYNEVFVFSLYVSKSNKLTVSSAFVLKNGVLQLLTEQQIAYQPRSAIFYLQDFQLPEYDLLCASHDGRFAFASQSGSRVVKMISISQQSVIKEFSFFNAIYQLDCNQQGSLLALLNTQRITLFDTISGRETYIQNVRPQCFAFYKATLFKPENCISPAFLDLSKSTVLNDEQARQQQRHYTTLQQTMLSLQLQTNHRSLDYQIPQYEFLAFANKNDVTCFIYAVQRREHELYLSPAVCFDFVRYKYFGGKIDYISWCDGLLTCKCDDNVVICATREDGDGISGVVSAGILGIGNEAGSISVGRSIVIGCERGIVVFEGVE